MNNNQLFTVGIEIDILEKENFLKIKETLTRIGVSHKTEKTLVQSTHILHKRDETGKSRYSIVHFKEMFKLDGKPTEITEDDLARRNLIVSLLEEWNLCKIVDEESFDNLPMSEMSSVKVISAKEKSDWRLVSKYTVGGKR